jgi:hypothetical protein
VNGRQWQYNGNGNEWGPRMGAWRPRPGLGQSEQPDGPSRWQKQLRVRRRIVLMISRGRGNGESLKEYRRTGGSINLQLTIAVEC